MDFPLKISRQFPAYVRPRVSKWPDLPFASLMIWSQGENLCGEVVNSKGESGGSIGASSSTIGKMVVVGGPSINSKFAENPLYKNGGTCWPELNSSNRFGPGKIITVLS